MSNTELTGPFQSINLLIPEASHFLGTRSQSSSTLSQDMAVQEISYVAVMLLVIFFMLLYLPTFYFCSVRW